MFARGLRPPIVQAIEIDGRGGDHMLEMRLGQAAVPGLTQVTDTHALRQGPFHPGKVQRALPCSHWKVVTVSVSHIRTILSSGNG